MDVFSVQVDEAKVGKVVKDLSKSFGLLEFRNRFDYEEPTYFEHMAKTCDTFLKLNTRETKVERVCQFTGVLKVTPETCQRAIMTVGTKAIRDELKKSGLQFDSLTEHSFLDGFGRGELVEVRFTLEKEEVLLKSDQKCQRASGCRKNRKNCILGINDDPKPGSNVQKNIFFNRLSIS